jgi:hypothetical protein
MKNFLKAHWKKIAAIAVVAIFALTIFLQRDTVRGYLLPQIQTPVDPTPQLNMLSAQLDSALVVLWWQDKALKETLVKLRTVEWQLAVSTKMQMQNYDSLSAAFHKVSAVVESDDELDKLLGR